MDEGDPYSKQDREEHARRKAEMHAQHQARVREIQSHLGMSWSDDPNAPALQLPKDTAPPKVPAVPGAHKPRGKKRWVYFRASGRWVEATEAGLEAAIAKGQPVRRSNSMPKKPPETTAFELDPDQ